MGHYLITGAGGYLGNLLVRRLLNGRHKVRAMDNFHRGNCDSLINLTENSNFEFVRGDITSERDCQKACKDVDGIFHLAAIVGNPACVQNIALSDKVNMQGTANLLKYKSKEQRFVFCSTECVYGSADEYNEDVSPHPTSLYANQKFEAEQYVLDSENSVLFRFGAAMGLSHIPRINLLVNTLVYEAITNKSLVLFEADLIRNFISVKDMVGVLHFGMFDTPLHKIYNAGNIHWTKRQIADYISSKTGCHLFYGDVNKDPDKRDKVLNCDKILAESFRFAYRMEETIDELIRGLPLVNIQHNYI